VAGVIHSILYVVHNEIAIAITVKALHNDPLQYILTKTAIKIIVVHVVNLIQEVTA